MRVLAIDWSGDSRQAKRRIWLAEAVGPGRLARLEGGRDREALAEHLLEQADQPAVIGLDFGFSFPAWFLATLGVDTAPALWAHVVEHGEAWLAACAAPFWGRPGRARPAPSVTTSFRRAELAVPRIGGIGPKSMFQIGGAGAVGTGSLRGMPLLHRLHQAGASIWPLAATRQWPQVVEIYPRLLTGPVRKSDPAARADLLARNYPDLDAEHRRLATQSEDAFDAAVSALVMHTCQLDLAALPAETDPQLRLEGRIWHPAWRQDRL
jgi:hypothetical protein